MKLTLDVRVPQNYDKARLTELFRDIQTQLNMLSEEGIDAHYGAKTSVPTTGVGKKGDFVRNQTPSEAGSVSSKYVVLGWVCVASGTPGTWREARVLTGN